jgi:hypothetical protein
MRTLRLLLVTALVLAAAPVWAQGPVNPSTLSWTAPTTNDCTGQPAPCVTALTDLAGYNIRAAGPLATAVCPAYAPASYPVKKTVASTTTTPTPNTTLTFGTPGSGNLAGDLGITVDGQYCLGVTAFDNAPTQVPPSLLANESGVTLPVPFVRKSPDRVAPSAPTGGQVNP